MRKCWDYLVVGMLMIAAPALAQEDSLSTFAGISRAAPIDYGYISEREIQTLTLGKSIDLEMVKYNDLAFKNNLAKALDLSLMDLNNMLQENSEQEYQEPIFQKVSYLGADVHLHMMHIYYAQTLMQEWERKQQNLDMLSLGMITADDISFYKDNSYQSGCKESHKYGLCFTAYSPTVRGLFALSDYAQDLRESLLINDGDTLKNYQMLIKNQHKLEDKIYHDIRDSNTVGVKEYQEREQKRLIKKHNVKQSVDSSKENGISESSLSIQREFVEAKLQGKIDAMISLDDLPNGYIDDYERNNKKFKLEYLFNNKQSQKRHVQSNEKEHQNALAQAKEDSWREIYVEQIPQSIDKLIDGANEVLPVGTADLSKKCYETYRKHKGSHLVQPITPFNVTREHLYHKSQQANGSLTQEQSQNLVRTEQRPTFKDSQGTYFDYSLLFHVSNDAKSKGLLIKGTEAQ